jgi:two-component system sensor histidine kinase/response regulator
MDDYIAKPIRSQELYRAIEKGTSEDPSSLEPNPSPQPSPVTDDAIPPEVFDARKFVTIISDESLVRELIPIFAEDAAPMLADAEKALLTGDAEALHRATHSLKGLVGNYSALEATKVVTALDNNARSGDLTSAAQMFPKVAAAIERLGHALEAFGKTLKG